MATEESVQQVDSPVTVCCERTGKEVDSGLCLECSKSADCCPTAYLRIVFDHVRRTRTGIHVSDLAGCLRKAYYRRTKAAGAIRPGSMLNLIIGLEMHDMLAQAGKATEVPVSVTRSGITIVGTVDAIDGGVVEYKTTRWLKPQNLPYGNHVEQVRFYAAMLHATGHAVDHARIHYMDMSGPTRCPRYKREVITYNGPTVICKCGKEVMAVHRGFASITVAFSQTELEETLDRMFQRAIILNRDAIPDRETSALCSYCDYEEECKGGA